MGITGLLPFVKNSCRPVNIKDFSGASVAVDTYSWLHKGAFSCAEKLVKGEKTDGYVHYCLRQLNLLLEAGLKPIMVFDGCNLSSKAVTEKKRRENREKTRQRGKELLCEGKVKEARECFQRCVDVTPEMAREVIEAFRKKSIDCIVAPYEADAQLAYVNKIGMAQVVITEDSDLILFGCNKILFKMDNCGGGLLYESENLPKSFGNKALSFSFEKFRYMCILSGCDYLPSLPGIGLAKAYKFFSLTNNTDLSSVLSKLPSYLKMPKLVVSDEYKESFIKANNTFLYQLVFCPKKKCMIPLNSYPEGISQADFEYAGKYLPDDVACQLALGNINVKTMEEFDSDPISDTLIDEDKSLVWGSQNSSGSKVNNSKVSAFKFSTPKQKISGPKKRSFIEMVDSGIGAECTDEDLFSMYSSSDSKKNCNLSISSEEDPLGGETNSVLEQKSPLQKTQPKLPNIPFRKIVKSRFFATERDLNKDLIAQTQKVQADESKEDFLLSSDNNVALSNASSLNNSFSSSLNDICDSSPEKISSPKKSNKENIAQGLSKVKPDSPIRSKSLPSKCNLSPHKHLKDSWLDIIENESSTATSTLSSSGKSSKLLGMNCGTPVSKPKRNIFKSASKKLVSTKLHDYKWRKSDNVPNLDCSQESGDNSCDESSIELVDLENEQNNDSFVSPYFQSDTDSSQVVSLECNSQESGYQSQKIEASSSLGNETKVNLTSDSKTSKVAKCRTLGLSKRKKNFDKVPRKETLLNFNFIRQPKKEVCVT